jgi:signal transduction histidine kinase
VDLRSVVDSTLTLASTKTKARAAVEVDLPDELPMVQGSADELGQVLLNLVMNAADAVPAEGGRIGIRARVAASGVSLEVADNGPGIPEELRPKLFHPFFTTKKQGTGLGLAISKRIAHDHGGTLDFRSRAGEGTTFVLTLPASPSRGGLA